MTSIREWLGTVFLTFPIILIISFVFLLYPLTDKQPSVEDLDKIIEKTHEKISQNPDDLKSHIELAQALFLKGTSYYEESLNEFYRAKELGSLDHRVFYYSGQIYDALGVQVKAVNEYLKYLRLFPDSIEIRYKLGNLYFRHKKLDDAIEQYEILYKKEPKNIVFLCNLGLIYEEKGFYDEAYDKFLQAEKLSGKKQVLPKEINSIIGWIELEKGEKDKAEKNFNTELKYNPGSVSAKKGLDKLKK